MDSFASNSLLLVLGLALLFLAVNWFGQSLSRLLTILKVSDVFKGVVLASVGISSLELVLSIFAVTGGEKAMALGTILGLCVANLGLALGVGALLNPLPAEKDIFRREAPAMFVSFILLYILCRDLEISRFDGLLLILFFVLFIFMACRGDSFKSIEHSVIGEGRFIKNADWRASLVIALIAMAAMILGADLVFKGGRIVGDHFGFGGWLVGLVVIAAFIALTKALASLTLYRKENKLSASGLVSANVFNVLLVIGVMALVNPIYLSSSVIRFDIPIILIFSVMLLFTVRTGCVVTRRQGAMALFGYIVFLAMVIIKNR